MDPPPRVMKIKAKINKRDIIKYKNFCTAEETINQRKTQPIEWEEILANEATDKGLISKIYNQLLQFNIKNKQLTQNISRRPKQTFLQRRHTVNRHMIIYIQYH